MQGIKRRKVWKITALFSALLMLPLFSPAAQADGFALGALFRVGAVHFNLAFGDFGHGHPRGYYYRTANPISYRNVRCNDYCFNSGGHHYHHESCPLVRSHLAYFDIDPLGLFDRYAPAYGPRYGYGYGYNGNRSYGYDHRYDRHDGYYRYDNRRDGYNRSDRYPYRDRDHRYDRRDRDRGRYDRDHRDRHNRDRGDWNGRNDRGRRNDGRHDRHDGGHHGGHSSSDRPRQ